MCGGILTELPPWPFPLTALESWLEARDGIEPYQGGCLFHYLDRLVCPDISATVLTVAGTILCALNLAFCGWQIWVGSVSIAGDIASVLPPLLLLHRAPAYFWPLQ